MSAPTEFLVICQQIVTGENGFEVCYEWDGQRFLDRKAAIKHGFKIRSSDDFNIAVVRDETLISFDWMERPVEGNDAAALLKIQEGIFDGY